MYRTERERRLELALLDMLAGWEYIRRVHGDLYGVGWDRAQEKAYEALTDEAAGGGEKRKIICRAKGDQCHGCAHYWGKVSVCEFADDTSPTPRERVPDEIRELPKQWRKMLNRTDAGYYSMTVCADELERAIDRLDYSALSGEK